MSCTYYAGDVHSEQIRKRLYQLADFLESHPDRWSQNVWGIGLEEIPFDGKLVTCGTHMCIAGTVVALAGARPRLHGCDGRVFVDWTMVDFEGGMWSTPTLAARLLGLDPVMAELLFGASWEPEVPVAEFLRRLADQ